MVYAVHDDTFSDGVSYYIEIRGIYDGWSVAVMKDGRWVNRWHPNDIRHDRTQKFIDENEKAKP